eukprot:364238-Chlamydomonas_euryale.AAC.4
MVGRRAAGELGNVACGSCANKDEADVLQASWAMLHVGLVQTRMKQMCCRRAGQCCMWVLCKLGRSRCAAGELGNVACGSCANKDEADVLQASLRASHTALGPVDVQTSAQLSISSQTTCEPPVWAPPRISCRLLWPSYSCCDPGQDPYGRSDGAWAG